MTDTSFPQLTVGITGSSGFIGTALTHSLCQRGHQVIPIHRDRVANREMPSYVLPKPSQTAGPMEAVIHLAGEPLGLRWTAAKKRCIRSSRVEGTHALCQALAGLECPPQTLLCASAIGYYGSRGIEPLDERSVAGHGFLAEVTQAWEQAARPAIDRGIRVVFLRFGLILDRHGGALSKMLWGFRLGLGGPMGNGRQYWSWITLDDAMRAMEHALIHERLVGPVNVVAPRAVTNREFSAALGHVLHRPAFAGMPIWTARVLFGELADEVFLASANVKPRRLLETGFVFEQPELSEALKHVLAGN